MKATNDFWWHSLQIRPVWIEITRRPNDEIGIDLNHDNKRTFPLLADAERADFVLHWDSKRGCFVGCSRIADNRVAVRDGYHFRKVHNFVQFPENAISLDAIRSNWRRVQECYDIHKARVPHNSPSLFPFAKYDGSWKKLRPQLNYLTVASPELVGLIGGIYESFRRNSPLFKSWQSLGLGDSMDFVNSVEPIYKFVDEFVEIANGKARVPNSSEIERSTRIHRQTQNQVAVWLRKNGLSPFGSQSLDPLPVDIQWRNGPVHVVGEVKSLKIANETSQMRLGIGQVLHYRRLFENLRVPGVKKTEAALIVSREPDPIWISLCADLQIRLAWPSNFKPLIG